MTEEDAIQQRINRVINVSPPARMDIKEHGKYLERILTECISIEDFCEADRRVAIEFSVVNQQHWDRSGPERIVVMESQR